MQKPLAFQNILNRCFCVSMSVRCLTGSAGCYEINVLVILLHVVYLAVDWAWALAAGHEWRPHAGLGDWPRLWFSESPIQTGPVVFGILSHTWFVQAH